MSTVHQLALDLGDGAPRQVDIDTRTGRALGAPARARKKNGPTARDSALALALENERNAWRALHDKELRAFLIHKGGAGFIAEDFRRWFARRGNDEPHHHNVWGAMWMAAARTGLVVKTGHYRQMQDVRSHARITTEWKAPHDLPPV